MPSAWTTVLANLAAGVADRPGRAAPARRHGPGRDASPRRLHRRARPVRRLQLLDRAARARARQRAARPRARRSRSSASARRATTSCAASSSDNIIEVIDLRAVTQIGFDNADAIGEKILALFEERRVRRRDAVLLALQVGDRANPDRAAAHPGRDRRRRAAGATSTRRLRIRAGRGRDPGGAAAAQHLRCRSSARCSKTPPPSRARA